MSEYNLQNPYSNMELKRQMIKNIVFYNPNLMIILTAIEQKTPLPVTAESKERCFRNSREFISGIVKHYDKLTTETEISLYEEGERDKLMNLYTSITPELVDFVLNSSFKPMKLEYKGSHKPSDTCMWKNVASVDDLPRADGNITGDPYLPPSEDDVKSFQEISSKTKTYTPKIYTMEVGKPLYHSTTVVFDKPGQYTNWFSVNKAQTQLHVIDEIANREKPDPVYLYNYEYLVSAPLKLIMVNDLEEWDKLSDFFNLNLEPGTTDDYILAGALCKLAEKSGEFDGWYFPFDQDQVMLCHSSLGKINSRSFSYFHRTYYGSEPLPHSPLIKVHAKFEAAESMEDIDGIIEYNNKYFGCYLMKELKSKGKEAVSSDTERISVYWDTDTYIYSTFRRAIDSLVDEGVLDRNTVDKNFNTFVTASVTNALRPYIYSSINILGQMMESEGIFVISGGEAINHLLPEEYRILTPDIDTKFVPLNISADSFEMYMRTMITRNKMWYQGMEAVLRVMEENYPFIYLTNLLPLEKTTVFRLMGVKFLHPDIVKNPRYNPEKVVFVKRQVIAHKEDHYNYSNFKNIGVGRLFDVYIYSIDMRIQSSYEYNMEQNLAKCGVRYYRDYLYNDDLDYLNDILREIGSVREHVDTVEEAREIIRDFYEQCSYGFLMDLSGDLARQEPSTIAGILDCPLMRPGELGYDIKDNCSISHSFYKDGEKTHNFINYTASYEYIDEDIDIMINLGLRAGKVEKDKRRQKLLKKLEEKELIRKPLANYPEKYIIYNQSGPWVKYRLTKINTPIDQLYKYTLFSESSITKTLSDCAPPTLKGYIDQNGLIDFDELVKRISAETGDSPEYITENVEIYVTSPSDTKFNYENKKWIGRGDILTNCFMYRFASYELSSVRKTGKIILDMLSENISNVIYENRELTSDGLTALFYNLMKMQYSMPYFSIQGKVYCLSSLSIQEFAQLMNEKVVKPGINILDLLHNIVYDVLAQCYHLYEPIREGSLSPGRLLLTSINSLGNVLLSRYADVRPILLEEVAVQPPLPSSSGSSSQAPF